IRKRDKNKGLRSQYACGFSVPNAAFYHPFTRSLCGNLRAFIAMITNLSDFQKFAIGFDPRDKKKVFEYWDEIFSNQRWTEGRFTRLFEEKWSAWNGVQAVATSSWAGAAMACMEYFGLAGKTVLCPTNTFMATPLAAMKSKA